MDSEDEIEETPTWKGVPATIICINAYDRAGKTLELAHSATCGMLRQTLRMSGSNFIGVCLYGTEVKNSSILGINSVKEVFSLKLPTIDDYKDLQNVQIASLDEAKNLILSEVLWYCSRAFASCKRQLSSRNIVLLSRLDVPPLQSDQKPALKRVVELADSNIDIKLINISETEYDIDTFYNNFLIEANKKEEVILPKPIWDKKEIEQLIHQQSHRHLAVARFTFEIGENIAIGVGIYSLTKNQGHQPWKKTDLHRDYNTILTSVNKSMKVSVQNDAQMDIDEEVQESKSVPLLKSELLHYKTLGGERIQFTDDEMKMLKNPFGSPMLKLLGFKPAYSICKEKWFLKSCYFLFPNEDLVNGSTIAFKSLYQACVKTNKIAICVLCTRVNARPVIVALSPSSRPFGLDVDIGFDIIRIPFVENVRQLPAVEDDDDDVQIPDANKLLMKDILGQLCFDYKPKLFENPKVQTQYRAIEAIALDEDNEDEPFIDTTKPDFQKFENLQDELFQELFGPFGPVAVKKPMSSKGGPTSKKPKIEIDEELFQSRLDNQKIKDYTVSQLKEILFSRNLSNLPALTGLKKNDLVELVYKHCK